MKSITAMTIVAGVSLSASLSAQVVATPNNSGEFYNIISSMTNNVGAIYAPPAYGSFTFSFEGDPLIAITDSEFVTFAGNVPSAGSYSRNFLFEPFTIPANFTIEGNANIGYFGNESYDNNTFGYFESLTEFPLFNYTAMGSGTTPPPYAYVLGAMNDNFPVDVTFYHRDDTFIGSRRLQNNDDHFRGWQYQEQVGQFLVSYYVFAIDDRGFDKIDYDDGFFLFRSTIDTGFDIPEPSTVGMIAGLGLVGILFLRRRKIAKKS